MKHLYRTLSSYITNEIHWPSHLYILLFLTICTTINFSIDLEHTLIDKQTPALLRPFCYLLLQITIYGGAIIIIRLTDPHFTIRHPKKFILFTLLFLSLLSLNFGFPFSSELARAINPPKDTPNLFYYTFRVWVALKSALIVLLPGLLIYRLTGWGIAKNYGLNSNSTHIQPYFLLIACMVPLLLAASFLPDFQRSYPRYHNYSEYLDLNLPHWLTIGIYELAYGFSFLTIEFIMRGVFVLGSAYFLGRKAILPMAALYVSIHYGKPVGEAISSFFGGYILGILALHSKNIYGGVIAHLGVAWLMEAFAFWQK